MADLFKDAQLTSMQDLHRVLTQPLKKVCGTYKALFYPSPEKQYACKLDFDTNMLMTSDLSVIATSWTRPPWSQVVTATDGFTWMALGVGVSLIV